MEAVSKIGSKIKQAFGLDDFLIGLFLMLTIWHLAHVLSAFEPIAELAWPVAAGIDIGIARAAWVTSNRSLHPDARKLAFAWLLFLLVYSFGLNAYYYGTHGAAQWSYALAALYPMSLALAGGVKSFLDQAKVAKAQDASMQPAPATTLFTSPVRKQRTQQQSAQLANAIIQAPVSLAELPEPIAISSAAQALDKMLNDANLSRQQVLKMLKDYNITSAESAYRGLRITGKLPEGMLLEDFQPLYAELVAKPSASKASKKPASAALAGGSKAKPTSLAYGRVLNASSITQDMLTLTPTELGSLSRWHTAKYAEYVAVRDAAKEQAAS